MSSFKVFGLGISKTGTTTLTAVLQQLGFDVKHYRPNPSDWGLYDGITDIPTCFHYRHLDVRFPDAKFIFTTRDEDDYIKSTRGHFKRPYDPIMQLAFGLKRFNEAAHRKIFRDHAEAVKAYFQRWYPQGGKIIFINLCDGGDPDEKWKAICDHLGVTPPAPGTPIPWKNRRNFDTSETTISGENPCSTKQRSEPCPGKSSSKN